MNNLKKILISLLSFSIIFMNLTFVVAASDESVKPKAVIYCEFYKGKHKVTNMGMCDIYSTKGVRRFLKHWGYYECPCGARIFCSDYPDSDATKGIPGYYIETNKSKELIDSNKPKGKDHAIYKNGWVYNIKTDLPDSYKSVPLTSYTFV